MDPAFTGDSLHLRSMPGSLEELAQLPQPLVVPQVSVVPQMSVSTPASQIEPAQQQPLKIPQITINPATHLIERFQPSQQTFGGNSFSASVTDLPSQTDSQAQESENLFSDEENMLTIPLYDTFQNQSPTSSIVESVLDQSKSQIGENNDVKKTVEIQQMECKIMDTEESSQSQFTVHGKVNSALNEDIIGESVAENIPQNSDPSETIGKSVDSPRNERILNCETGAMEEEETEHDLFKFFEKEKRKAVLESSLELQADVTQGNVHTSPLEKSESDTDMLKLVQDRLNEEKNMFSENLGLIPKEIEEKIIKKTRSSARQMQTRNKTGVSKKRKLEIDESVDIVPITGHEHVMGLYKCGGCSKIYTKICKLHEHLNDHTEGGSYHYDHVLHTAFPKFGTACANTQTSDDKEIVVIRKRKNTSKEKKPFGRGIQFKKPIEKSPKTKATAKYHSVVPELVEDEIIDASPPAKKKRGRPKKGKKMQQHPKEKKVTKIKFKVKTEDGGDTWKEVKNEPEVYIDDDTEAVSDGNTSDSASVSINQPAVADGTDATDMLMDLCMKDIESDLASIISSPPGSPKRKSHKRKMTIPRKILHTPSSDSEKAAVTDSDSGKIINSRAKPEKKITCDFCPRVFQYTRGLIRHEQEMHEDEMKFSCDVCPQKFMREYNLKRHKLCSHTVGKVRFIRNKKVGSVGSVFKVKGKPGRKPRDTSPQRPTECEVCGKMVPSSKLEIHRRIHTGDRPYICHVCGKGLISDKKLKRHLLIHSEIRRHTCDVCGEGFSMKYKLRTHMFLHTGHKPYLCSACGAEFNNSTSLLHHHRTVHLGDKRFECTICGGRYGKKSQLEEHMFSHSTERTQTCRYCGKTFKHAKSLRRHEATHVSDMKFPCDQCESKFSRKDNLERHKMCHYESTLQCSFCKKKFRDKKPLMEHEQFHVNQRRFQCQLCKEKFQEETYFYNHMEKNHQLTKEMVPVINALASGSDASKDDKDDDNTGVATHDIGIDVMKVQNSGSLTDQQLLPLAGQTQDTLNLSMNVAGIIPVTNHEIISTSSHSAMQNLLTQQNSVVNQLYIPSQNQINVSRNILNQPATSSFTSTNQIIQAAGIHDNSRAALNVMNSMNSADNVDMRITIDQQSGTLSMTTSENLMIHEQQRLMQEALGTSLGIQAPGYRLQNLY